MPEAAASSPLNESAEDKDNDKDKDEMPTMGFLDHLEELRKRIIYSIVAIAVGFFACWGYAEKIYEIMQRPIMDALQQNGLSAKLVYLNPTEPFNLYLKVGAMAGLFVASPFVLYQVWCFISPGLTATRSATSCPSWSRPWRYSWPADTSATNSSFPRRSCS